MPTEPTGLADLKQLFHWHDAALHEACCTSLERSYVTAVASGINARLDETVRAELEALPDTAYLSIVRGADAFFSALYGRSEDLARSVARWIVVERAVLGERTDLDGTVRAAGCDRQIAAVAGRIVAIEALPRIANTNITLDYASELPGRLATRFPDRRLVSPSADQRAATEDKLAAAWALLEAVSPLAADFVRRMTDVICCRTAVDDLRFYTASDQTTLGVIHLINAHLPRKTAAELAAELVHEAIHQAVFRWELSAPPLVDRELAGAQVISPWTGATLDLYAFVHACFVWYGVANLWRLATAPPLPAIEKQRAIAEAGFAKDPLGYLGEHAARLPAVVVELVGEMAREISRSRAA